MLQNAIHNAVTNGRGGLGVVFVNSSGNEFSSSVIYPANLPHVIAVGAIKNNGQRASDSNYGDSLNVVAPGVSILSSDRQGNDGYNTANGTEGNYINCGGTSAACPHVAGVAALMLSANPSLKQQQVRKVIESTCNRSKLLSYIFTNNPAVHPNGSWNSQVGYGLVDAYEAVYSVAPRIEVSDTVCYNGSPFTIINPPSKYSVIYWTITGPFSFSSSSNVTSITASASTSLTVFKRIGYTGTTGTITARIGNASNEIFATKQITACVTKISGDNMVCNNGSNFKITNQPPNLIWTVTGPFSFSSSSSVTSTTVTNPTVFRRTGTAITGVLSARSGGVNGTEVTSKALTPCAIISGPTELCRGSSAKTFTVTNDAPAGFTWGKSDNLNLVSNGYSASVSASSSGSGTSGWVSINAGGTEVSKFNVSIPSSAPVFSYISGGGNIALYNYGSGPYGYCVLWAYFSGSVTKYSWTGWSPTLAPFELWGTSNQDVGVGFSAAADYVFMVYGSNACGGDYGYEYITTYINRGSQSYINYYPNPVSDILYIEIDAQTALNAQSQQPTLTNGQPLKVDPTFDIRLYDKQGNLLRHAKTKGGTLEFNVASLPDGIYYLHIYDGVSSTPEFRQIMVER